MTTIISGFHPGAYERYAKNFLETFDRYFPPEIAIHVWVEENILKTWKGDRIHSHSLWDCQGQRTFIEQNKDILERNGRAPVEEKWTKRAYHHFARNGYSFRYDAVRFSRQLFIPEQAAKKLPDGEIMVWFDADVIAFDTVPVGFLERLIGFSDICTLGRDGVASDLGYWAIKLSPLTRRFVNALAECCRSGNIFSYDEWHSGYIFDRHVEKLVNWGAKHTRLTNVARGHVWFDCELGRYTDHLKGEKRKDDGFSRERFGRGVVREEPEIIRPKTRTREKEEDRKEMRPCDSLYFTPDQRVSISTSPSCESASEPSKPPIPEQNTSS